MSADTDLILASARLARRAPQEWNLFSKAFQDYAAAQAQHCIQSPLEELPRSQGRAQSSARLAVLFADCLTSADKIEGKQK